MGTCIFVHGEGSYQYCLSLLLLDTLITGISLRVSSFTCASPCVSTKAGDQTNNVSAHGGAKEVLSKQNIENQSVKTLYYQCMPLGFCTFNEAWISLNNKRNPKDFCLCKKIVWNVNYPSDLASASDAVSVDSQAVLTHYPTLPGTPLPLHGHSAAFQSTATQVSTLFQLSVFHPDW